MLARKGQKFEGLEVTGTAQVLSVQPITSTANWGSVIMCRIGLRVEIPGHAPYDVTVKTRVPQAIMYSYSLNGSTVTVQVDSANVQNVRVDFSQPPSSPPQPPPGPTYVYGSSSYSSFPPGMRRLGIASAWFLGIWTLAAFAYQAHALWGISTYAIVSIMVCLMFVLPLAYFTYRRTRRDSQPPPPQATSFDWSSPTTGNMSYGEQPPLDGPQPQPVSPYDSLSPGVRMYQRVLWGLIGFGFIAAIVVLVVVLLIARH